MAKPVQKIGNCLWLDDQAEPAAKFYTSVFANSELGDISRYDKASSEVSGKPEGSVLTVEFVIDGCDFMTLNGGPNFTPNPSVSFFVNCKTAEEVDSLWEKLSDGGKILMPLDKYFFSEKYGWVQDKFGVSWQLLLAEGGFPQKIMPSLLFVGEHSGKAEEAITFYTSIFKNSKKKEIYRYEAGQAPDKEGTIAYADFELEGQTFAAMDSAQKHDFTFNEGVSFVVNCETQEEIDHYWNSLSAVPEAEQCGWLKDKYGVAWQIVPVALTRLLKDPDPAKAERVMKAMLDMKKLVIADLEKAAEEK